MNKTRPGTGKRGFGSNQQENNEEQQKNELLKKEMIKHVLNEKGELPLIFQKSQVFLNFESQLQAEIYNSRCHDSGDNISDEEKAIVFKEEFNKINNKKNDKVLNLYSLRLGVNSIVTLANYLKIEKSENGTNNDAKNIEILNLADNAISDYGMNAVKTLITQTNIKYLNLASNMISEAGLEMIVDELSKCKQLKGLDLGVLEGSIRKNSISVDGAKCLAAVLLQNKFLESLKLQDNDIGITGGEIIGTALKQNRTLKHLTIAENELKTQGAEFILKSGTYLESLDLGKNYIKAQIGPYLKEYLQKNPNLKKLNLEYNELLALGMSYLAEGLPYSNQLVSLNLKGNGIRDEGIETLASVLYDNQVLEDLDISLNEITPIGIGYLAEVLPTTSIKNLNISKNLLGDESLMIISDNAREQEHMQLVKLDISSSRISDSGILHFLEGAEFFENLKSIKASDNFISEKIEKILLEILEKNKNLVEFGLAGNRLSLCCMNRVKKILIRNSKELQEKEPNKIRTEIYRLKYEQKKIKAAKNKLDQQEKEINKLEEKKEKLRLELDRIRTSEKQRRQKLKEEIEQKQSLIQKKGAQIYQKEQEFEEQKKLREQELAEKQKEYEEVNSKRTQLQQELDKINQEMSEVEEDYSKKMEIIKQQQDEQNKIKLEMKKNDEIIGTEYNKLQRQLHILQEKVEKKRKIREMQRQQENQEKEKQDLKKQQEQELSKQDV